MEFVQIQHAQIPSLGLGTYKLRGRECREIVQRALGMGYRHIDTAQIYENETEVGSGLNGTSVEREDVWITTKVWHTHLDRKNFLPSVEESLRKLGVSYVDLLLIHWPNPEVPMEEIVEGLRMAQEKDYTRFVGVSNFPRYMVMEALVEDIPMLTNQVEYHPYLDQSDMLNLLREEGMALTAYSPLAQGKIVKDPTVLDIAEEIGKTPAQVVLRWLLDQDKVIAIPKTANPVRLRENIQISTMRLSDEQRKRINRLARPEGRLVNPPDLAPQWD